MMMMKDKKGKRGQNLWQSKSKALDGWALVEPHLEEIRQLRAEGALISQLADRYGVSRSQFGELIRKKPKLKAALDWGSKACEDCLTGKVYDIAMGRAVRVEKTEYKDARGRLKGSREKTIRLEPQLQANAFLLKCHHGWSEKPKVDDGAAGALDEKELKAFAHKLLNTKDTGDKS